MLLGIDFDNTIVCYDQLFHRVACEQGLIPETLPVNKRDVRDHLRQSGREEEWIEMQGYVYGPRLCDAEPFPGVLEFFRQAVDGGIDVCIISHKTRHPFRGLPYDLHNAALCWLEQHGFFDPSEIGLPRRNVYLELTKNAKLERIARVGCTHFVDDLPELLAEPAFPSAVLRCLFDPAGAHAAADEFLRLSDWRVAAQLFDGMSAQFCKKSIGRAGGVSPLVG
jgi:hypothetical protein